MLTELCTPGLCSPAPQAALPPQATAQLQPKPAEKTQPGGVAPQLQLETVQHEGQTSYTCKLQVSSPCHMLLHGARSPHVCSVEVCCACGPNIQGKPNKLPEGY